MAGKKKKSLANKLAKMSDEERARYLQHRAEIEEEAKRRKEQLIATFMKKKIKKEEAFGRLNLAKINQNWHQILRKIKVKEMKDDVEHLKTYIERALEYKNGTISKLMEELEEAEEQYSNNFKYHSIHLDEIITSQNNYINDLQMEYEKELKDFLDDSKKEEVDIIENSSREMCYLKTIIFGQEAKATKELKYFNEEYNQKLYRAESKNKVKLSNLRRTRGDVEVALWRQLSQVVRSYVQKTDARRCHLQELRRLDAESAEEIRRNEERMNSEEELIGTLENSYAEIKKRRGERLQTLELEEADLKKKFLIVKKRLKNDLALDELRLRFLSSCSNSILEYFQNLLSKGQHLVSLSVTCTKFETERERITKWIPITEITLSRDVDGGLTDDEKLYQRAVEKGFSLPKLKHTGSPTSEEKIRTRPMTSITYGVLTSQTTEADIDSEVESKKIAPIEDIKFEAKKLCGGSEDPELEGQTSSGASSVSHQRDILDECIEDLEKMESFWNLYNKVEIDVMELKEERSVLQKENKQLRGFIRAVLEAAALAKTIPDSKVSTRVPSQRAAYSAPLRRILLN
ncbi:dynein regulatory complex subunit 2 [Sitophilus oryzae]|uniref:Dynein regulatory complex subunit 2 n=1 Tax=Sitophilus oryzae TaxID=7048 RepID=A0A6J2XW98_SITOR|nr:dynein regulatory complex subunit 2 [Sitophilus oryzae]